MSAQLYLTERHQAIAEATRGFAEREIRPIAARLDETEEFPSALYKQMCGLGMMGITIPEALGVRRRGQDHDGQTERCCQQPVVSHLSPPVCPLPSIRHSTRRVGPVGIEPTPPERGSGF